MIQGVRRRTERTVAIAIAVGIVAGWLTGFVGHGCGAECTAATGGPPPPAYAARFERLNACLVAHGVKPLDSAPQIAFRPTVPCINGVACCVKDQNQHPAWSDCGRVELPDTCPAESYGYANFRIEAYAHEVVHIAIDDPCHRSDLFRTCVDSPVQTEPTC